MEEYTCIGLIRNKKFLHYFILYSSIFIFSFIISMIIGLEYTSLSDGTIFFIKNYTSLGYGSNEMISILANNFFISSIMMYYFYSSKEEIFKKFLGVFHFLYIGSIGGLVVSNVVIKYNLIIALSMIVPHGIIEIPAVAYAFSSGWALSDIKDKRQSKMPKEFIYASMILFVMLSISAYIESYITPSIYYKLLSYYY